jgi:hypothetical protein
MEMDRPVTVKLSEETFARLQNLAVPLVDTIESVIKDLLDKQGPSIEPEPTHPIDKKGDGVPAYPATMPPDLTHTKLLSCSFNGVDLVPPSWNGLLVAAIRAAHAKSPAEMKRLVGIPYVKGKEDEGYKHLADIDISYQGQDAKSAWKVAQHIAQKLGIEVTVDFAWRHKVGAAFPGQSGRMVAGIARKAA